VRQILAELDLATVCSSAHCPNLPECFACGTATFLILGDVCTRNCRFCAIRSSADPGPLREDEPEAVAEASARLGLRYVVITSVTRDDLADGGAAHFARTVRAVRDRLPEAVIEVLTSDFKGNHSCVETVLEARPDVFNHNVETVPRLYPRVRPQADYRRSLEVLAYAGKRAAGRGAIVYTKSGLMVGLGETVDEVLEVMRDLRELDVDILTIGQYLQPTKEHIPITRYYRPEEFEMFRERGYDMGFRWVESQPLVRSSYHADAQAEALSSGCISTLG